jgi:acetyl esterase/lipase
MGGNMLDMTTPRSDGAAGRTRRRWSRAARLATVAGLGVALLAACTRPTPTPTPGGGGTGRYRSQVFSRVEKVANVTYSTAPGKNGASQALKLDIYRPAGDTATKRPLFITAFAGAFIFGSKDLTSDPAYQMAQYYAQLGYVTANINYRLLATGICTGNSPGAACKAAARAGVEDGHAAVRFLRANADKYGIDPDRIAIGGDSAGGVISAGVGVTSELAPETNKSTPGVSSKVRAFMALSGGLPADELAGKVDANDSPGVLFTGTADPIVPSAYSNNLAQALKAVGVDAKVVSFPGAGHVPWGQKNTILAETTNWFYDHMDLANAPR